jgi:hypothetical protein
MGNLTEADIRQIENLPDNAVETGTCEGEQLLILTKVFKVVYGIEINKYYYGKSKQNAPLANMFLDDSVNILPEFNRNERYAFFLDAHYCKLEPPVPKTPFPLWEELKIIKARNQKDIIIIDDVHTFGKVRDDLRYGEEKEWELVTTESIAGYFPEAKTEIYKDSFIIWL